MLAKTSAGGLCTAAISSRQEASRCSISARGDPVCVDSRSTSAGNRVEEVICSTIRRGTL